MHAAVQEAFQQHYKRWTAAERMRLLLAWILQIRASLGPQPADVWRADPVTLEEADLDLPYKEIAAELANPNTILMKKKEKEKNEKEVSSSEKKMEMGDAAIMASLGLTED